jgi:CHASE3 domain sensor protein
VHRIERANRLLRNSRIIILVGFGLLAIATLALIIGLFRSREADMWVVHTFQVQQTAQALLISTRDAESAVRSYLLSGDGKDLDQFEPSLTDAGSQLKALAAIARRWRKFGLGSRRFSTPSAPIWTYAKHMPRSRVMCLRG